MKKNLIYTFVFLAIIFIPNLAKANVYTPAGVTIHNYSFDEDITTLEGIDEGDTYAPAWTSSYENDFRISTTTKTLQIGSFAVGSDHYIDDKTFSVYQPAVYDSVYINFDFKFSSSSWDANSPYVQLYFEGGIDILTWAYVGGVYAVCMHINNVDYDCDDYIITSPDNWHEMEIIYSIINDEALIYLDDVLFGSFNNIGGIAELDQFRFRRLSNGTSSDYIEIDNFIMSSSYEEVTAGEVFMYFNETTNTVTSAYALGYYPDDYEDHSFITTSYSNNGTATSTTPKLKDIGFMPEDIDPITRASSVQPACNLIDSAILYKTVMYENTTSVASSTIYIDCSIYSNITPTLDIEDYDIDSACDDVATSTGSFLSDVRYGIECSLRKVLYWSIVPRNEKIADFIDSVDLLKKTFPISLVSDALDIIYYPVTATSTPAQIPVMFSLVIPDATDIDLDLADFEVTTFYQNVYIIVYEGVEYFLYIITFVSICVIIYFKIRV